MEMFLFLQRNQYTRTAAKELKAKLKKRLSDEVTANEVSPIYLLYGN